MTARAVTARMVTARMVSARLVTAAVGVLLAAGCTVGAVAPAPAPVSRRGGPSGPDTHTTPAVVPTGPYDQFDDDTIPGITSATCIPGGSADLMRFGDFIVAGFATYDAGWDPRDRGSGIFFLTPRRPVESAPPLVVTATGPAGRHASFRTDRLSPADSTGTPYYVVGAGVPAAGDWTFHLAAGRRRGCFTFAVHRP